MHAIETLTRFRNFLHQMSASWPNFYQLILIGKRAKYSQLKGFCLSQHIPSNNRRRGDVRRHSQSHLWSVLGQRLVATFGQRLVARRRNHG